MCLPEFLCCRSDSRYCGVHVGHSGRLSEVVLTHYRWREVRNSIYRYRNIHIDYRSKFWYQFISSISIIYGNTNVMISTWSQHVCGKIGECQHKRFMFFSCDQAALCSWLYEWFSPSVRLSVRHTFLTMLPSSYHHEIFRSYYQWQKWRPCKRSRSEVKGQGHRGHDPTSPFPDCNPSLNSHMMMKSCIWLDDT